MNAYKSRMQAVCDTKVPIFAKLVTYEIDRIVHDVIVRALDAIRQVFFVEFHWKIYTVSLFVIWLQYLFKYKVIITTVIFNEKNIRITEIYLHENL
jgi:hypothetical protein